MEAWTSSIHDPWPEGACLIGALERDALHAAPGDTGSLEGNLQACELRTSSEPTMRGDSNAPHLLAVDHLERMPETRTALLLDLDEDESAATPEHEVDLVVPDPRVRGEQAVSTKAVVAEGAALAAIHAAS